jgi:hypothetical protein
MYSPITTLMRGYKKTGLIARVAKVREYDLFYKLRAKKLLRFLTVIC